MRRVTIGRPVAGTRELFALQQSKEVARALEERRGQPREPAYLYSIRAIGAARLETMYEQNAIADLAHGHVVVAKRGQLVGQLRQLVIVCREDRLAPRLAVEMFGDRPRDRHAVVR